jgi:hypothetical protein
MVVALSLALAALAPTLADAAPPPDCKKVEKKKRKGGRTAQLLAVAKCHHDAGQFTAAWYEYTEAAARARQAKDKKSLKVAEAGERENAGLLAWITVNADKHSELDIDGEKTISGAKKAVDPGKHTITAKGTHRSKPWSKAIDMKSGDVEEIAVPAPDYEPSTSVETPVPGSTAHGSSSSSSSSASPAASASGTPGADRHEESGDEDDDDEPHTGLAADIEALVTLYEETSAQTNEIRNGQAFVFMAQVAYDFTTSLRAFLRYGLVDNFAPGRSHAASVSNLALGASYGVEPFHFVRVAAEGGVILPIGTGGGTDPAQGVAVANLRARALHPTMFDPNFMTTFIGGYATTQHTKVVGRLEVFFDPSFKVNDAPDDKGKTRLRMAAHGGYRVLPWLEPFLELRYFRFLSSNAAIEADSSLADNFYGGLGIGALLGPLRAQVAYLRALDPPLTRIGFNVFAVRLGADF